VAGGDAEQGAEGGVPGAAAVEAEDELIEVGLEVLAAQPVIDAQGPDLEVGEDPVNPRQDDVGGHLADDMGIVGDAGGAGISGPTIGLGGGPGAEVGGEEGAEAGGRVIGHLAQADATGAKAAVFDLDGADDPKRRQQAAKLRPVDLGSARNFVEYPRDSGGSKLAHLSASLWPSVDTPRVPVNHQEIMSLYNKKALRFQEYFCNCRATKRKRS